MGNVLVTGAAGFVGRHLVRRLLRDGFHVEAVDNLVPLTGAVDPAKGWPIFDPRDYEGFRFNRQDCRAWFAANPEAEFDYAFHLAAVVGGRLMIENNPLAVADDLSIDAAFWQWAARAKPRKIVTFSSSAAYPISLQTRDNNVLLREDMIDFAGQLGIPDLSYGWAKLTTEFLGRLAHERHGLHSVCFRPFSGYGEDQDMAYPFPSLCQRAIDNADSRILHIWGTGQQMRDFIHIDDCIEGIMIMKDSVLDGDAINLSTGTLTSFIDLGSSAARLVGFEPIVQPLSDKPEGVFARGGDTAKQVQLGFRPRIDLTEGLDRVIRFLDHRT